MSFEITSARSGNGTYIRLPKGADTLHAAFRAAFPAATFYADSGKWYLRGSTAEKRLRKWADGQANALAQYQIEQDAARAAAIAERQAAADADKALGKLTTDHVTVRDVSSGLSVAFAYHADAVSIIRQIPGAAYVPNQRVWTVPALSRPALRQAIAKIEPILAAADVERQAEQAARIEERRTRQADLAKRRFPCPRATAPNPGMTLRQHDQVVVVESHGKPFRIDEDMPSTFGSEWLGHEGDLAVWVYFRPATEAEAQTLADKEAAAMAAAQAKRQVNAERGELAALIQSSGQHPAGQHSPKGERVLDMQNIYGCGDWFVVGPETIWYVRNNGMDGDDWSRNNVLTGGAGAIGWHVPYSDDLAHRLRAINERWKGMS